MIRFASAFRAAVMLCALTAGVAAAQPKGPPLDKDHAEKMARGLDIFKIGRAHV